MCPRRPRARDRAIVLCAVAAICAAVVAAAGLIAWVGLVMPHCARMLVGPDHAHSWEVARGRLTTPEWAVPSTWSSRWSNKEFQTLVDQIDRELDETKRKALVAQAEAIMEQDPPVFPVAWEKINDAWYNYVKGHNPSNYFGMFDVVRFDTFWLDT